MSVNINEEKSDSTEDESPNVPSVTWSFCNWEPVSAVTPVLLF